MNIIVKIINPINNNEILNEILCKNEINKKIPFYDIINKMVLILEDLHSSKQQNYFYKLIFDNNIVFNINIISIDNFNNFNIDDINELTFNIIYINNMINDLIDNIIVNVSNNTAGLHRLIYDLNKSYEINFLQYLQLIQFDKNQIISKYTLYSKYKYHYTVNNTIHIDNTNKLDMIIETTIYNNVIISIKKYDNRNIITYDNKISSTFYFDINPFYEQILNHNYNTEQLLDIYKNILTNLLENFCLIIE
jgi:hypothetical protein